MKLHSGLLAVGVALAGLQGCDGGVNLLNADNDTHHLIPLEPTATDPNAPRPSAAAEVITSRNAAQAEILDVAGQPILLRGVNLQFADDPAVRMDGIEPIAELGSNVVRLVLDADTTELQLENALLRIRENGLVAMLVLGGDNGVIACTDDETEVVKAVEQLWLGRWLPVLAQDRFQPHLMINIASQWGPMNVFNASSLSYGDYIDTYKSFIRDFRRAGFKVPLVIDAPHCGQDYNAFLGGRARSLLAVDPEDNLILSLSAYGGYWNSGEKLRSNLTALTEERVPVVITNFGGSGYDGDATIDHLDLMQKSAGDHALQLDIPWSDPNDKAAYAYDLPQALTLENATISVDVYVDRAYFDDGNFALQVFVKDAEYRYASLGFVPVSQLSRGNWRRLRYTISSLEDITGYRDEGFDISVLRQIGIEVMADGKAVEIGGPVKIDNLMVSLGAAAEPDYQADFISGPEGWYRGWAAPTVIGAADGNLTLLPDFSADNQLAVRVDAANFNLDFTKELSASVRIFLPEAYASQTSLYLEMFAHYGDDWSGFGQSAGVGLDALTPGQWNTVTFDLANILAGNTTAQAFGFQFSNLNVITGEPILIDRVTVSSAQSGGGSDNLYSAAFEADLENWVAITDWDNVAPAAFANTENAFAITPDWSQGNNIVAERAGITAVNGLNIASDFTVQARVLVPESYAGSGFYLKFFMQDGDDWTFTESNVVSMDDLVAGDWAALTFSFDSFPDNFDRSLQLNRFGFQFGGDSLPSGTVMFDDIRIVGQGADMGEVVLHVDFENEADLEAMAFSYAEGSLSEGALADAKRQGLAVRPFGWLAWSWKGNEGDAAVLDMSTEEDSVELTPRGEDIVNGPHGIDATSVPVNFTSQ